MVDKKIVKWTLSSVLVTGLMTGCATTQGQSEQPSKIGPKVLNSMNLGLKTPKPSECRFVKTVTVKFQNHWLNDCKSAHQLRENALRIMLNKAHKAHANYIHVRQISSETMGVFTYNYTSSVLATGDAFNCHSMPKESQSAASYLKQDKLTLGS